MRRFGFIPIALVTCLSAHAAEAPPQLRGNSIVVRWNEDRIQRHVGEPNFYPVAASHVLCFGRRPGVYAPGQHHARRQRRRRSGAGLGKPDVPQRVPDFDGRTMYVYLPFNKGGISPITKKMVEFKSVKTSTQTCTLRTGNIFSE